MNLIRDYNFLTQQFHRAKCYGINANSIVMSRESIENNAANHAQQLTPFGRYRRLFCKTAALGASAFVFSRLFPADSSILPIIQEWEKEGRTWLGKANESYASMMDDYSIYSNGRLYFSHFHKDDDPSHGLAPLMDYAYALLAKTKKLQLTGDTSQLPAFIDGLNSYWRDSPQGYTPGFTSEINPPSDPNGNYQVAHHRFLDDDGIVNEVATNLLENMEIMELTPEKIQSIGSEYILLKHLLSASKLAQDNQLEKEILQTAIKSFQLSMSCWDKNGGGIDWQQDLPRSPHYPPVAGSNGTNAQAALHLYQLIGDEAYLRDFKKIHTWMRENLLSQAAAPSYPFKNLYFDNKDQANRVRQTDWKRKSPFLETLYPHDIGGMIGAEVLAYQLTDRKEKDYLINAALTARDALQYFGNEKEPGSFFNFIPEYNYMLIAPIYDLLAETASTQIIEPTVRQGLRAATLNYVRGILNDPKIHKVQDKDDSTPDESYLFDHRNPGTGEDPQHWRILGSTAAFISILYTLAANSSQDRLWI